MTIPNYIIIDLNTSAPNLIVTPANESSGPIPFDIYMTADEPTTIYYRFDSNEPVPYTPGTYVSTTPFQFTFNSPGEHKFTYFGIDEVGNRTNTRYFTYYAGQYSVFSIDPRLGPISGGTRITITGEGFNFGAKILINNEAIPTEYGGSTKLYGRTLPLPEGVYNVQVEDPVNGSSTILLNSFTFIEDMQEKKVTEPDLQIGEVRKHVFETDVGPMVLTRKLVANYDMDTIVEGQVKELGVSLQLQQNVTKFPGKITLDRL